MIKAAAFDKPLEIGTVIPWLDGKYRIVQEIPRDQYWATVLRNRESDRRRGLAPARAGILTIDDQAEPTKAVEFRPERTNELRPEFQFCYVMEKLGT